MLEKLSKMSVRQAMATIGGGLPSHGELPRWLTGIAKHTGLSYRTVRSLWNDEIKNSQHHAARAIQKAADELLAQREREAHAAQYDSLVASLISKDEAFHSEDINSILYAADLLRKMART